MQLKFVYAALSAANFRRTNTGRANCDTCMTLAHPGLCTNEIPRFPVAFDYYAPHYFGPESSRVKLFDEAIGRERRPNEWDDTAYSQCDIPPPYRPQGMNNSSHIHQGRCTGDGWREKKRPDG